MLYIEEEGNDNYSDSILPKKSKDKLNSNHRKIFKNNRSPKQNIVESVETGKVA